MADKSTCAHDNYKKEYLNGMQTGDLVCLDCGDSDRPDDFHAERKRRQTK